MEEKFNGEDLEKLLLIIKLFGVNKVFECELDIFEVRIFFLKKKNKINLIIILCILFNLFIIVFYKMKIFFFFIYCIK